MSVSGCSARKRAISASETCRASHWESRLTSWSEMVSGRVDMGRQEDIISHGLGAQTVELARARELAEHVRPVAGKRRRDEHEQLVDEISRQEGGRERGPALEQQRLD